MWKSPLHSSLFWSLLTTESPLRTKELRKLLQSHRHSLNPRPMFACTTLACYLNHSFGNFPCQNSPVGQLAFMNAWMSQTRHFWVIILLFFFLIRLLLHIDWACVGFSTSLQGGDAWLQVATWLHFHWSRNSSGIFTTQQKNSHEDCFLQAQNFELMFFFAS